MSQEPQSEEKEGQPPAPPDELKPWYYQYWFLYPMVVFWPLWSVLIIRSPWHNGLIMGSLAWAYLIIGGYLSYVRLQVGGTVALSTVAIIAPGIMLTAITQVHWFRNRRGITEAARNRPHNEVDQAANTEQAGSTRSRRAGARQRRRRR